MKSPRLLIVFLFLFGLALPAQDPSGTLTGRLSDPDDFPVATASIELKQTSTGNLYQTRSATNGSYTLSGLPAGTYDLVIPTLGFTFRRLERKGIVVPPGKTTHLDIRFDWGGNLGTPGDDFSTIVRIQHPVPSGQTPRTADGKPDLSGVWVGLATSSEAASLLPWADTVFKARAASGAKEHPSNLCLPADIILNSPFIYKIVQTPQLIVLLWEGNLPGVDQIFLDGRPHPPESFPSWMGHSIGRWEGDTLVVDTTGFNDRSWLGITPHTEMLHIVQRYRRRDLGHLEKDVTIEDPGTFTKPWNMHVTWELAQGEEVQEMICESNHYPDHMAPK
ncbi:MAG: carboxypeptidase-like regulatory domain-containing protein [Acidobacteriota bacterium]